MPVNWYGTQRASSILMNPTGKLSATDVQGGFNELDTVLENLGGASIGTGNYIAEPFSVVPGTGLEVIIDPNRCVIDETAVESTAQTAVALTAKAAQLVFKKKDGTYDKLLPAMTAADLVDANTVGLWFPDGSASVPNAAVGVNGNTLAVANALTKSGTITAVDGWAGGDAARGDGSTGYYTSANSTGFPSGANIREITVQFFVNAIGANQGIVGYGTGTGTTFLFFVMSTGEIYFNSNGADTATGFFVEANKMYKAKFIYTGTRLQMAINGTIVWDYAYAANTTLANLFLFRRYDGSYSGSTLTIHFVQLQNAVSTPSQIATLAQKLLIPCAYNGTDIRDVLSNKTESVVLAFVRTSATAPTTIIDASDPKGTMSDWAYGIRVGPNGRRNKCKFLGWKYFSGATQIYWDNPFDTRKLRTSFVYAEDANGRNESEVHIDHTCALPGYGQTSAKRMSCYIDSTGAVYFNGAYRTSGYIGCYAEIADEEMV